MGLTQFSQNYPTRGILTLPLEKFPLKGNFHKEAFPRSPDPKGHNGGGTPFGGTPPGGKNAFFSHKEGWGILPAKTGRNSPPRPGGDNNNPSPREKNSFSPCKHTASVPRPCALNQATPHTHHPTPQSHIIPYSTVRRPTRRTSSTHGHPFAR